MLRRIFHELIIDVIKRKRQTTAETLAIMEVEVNNIGRVLSHLTTKKITLPI